MTPQPGWTTASLLGRGLILKEATPCVSSQTPNEINAPTSRRSIADGQTKRPYRRRLWLWTVAIAAASGLAFPGLSLAQTVNCASSPCAPSCWDPFAPDANPGDCGEETTSVGWRRVTPFYPPRLTLRHVTDSNGRSVFTGWSVEVYIPPRATITNDPIATEDCFIFDGSGGPYFDPTNPDYDDWLPPFEELIIPGSTPGVTSGVFSSSDTISTQQLLQALPVPDNPCAVEITDGLTTALLDWYQREMHALEEANSSCWPTNDELVLEASKLIKQTLETPSFQEGVDVLSGITPVASASAVELVDVGSSSSSSPASGGCSRPGSGDLCETGAGGFEIGVAMFSAAAPTTSLDTAVRQFQADALAGLGCWNGQCASAGSAASSIGAPLRQLQNGPNGLPAGAWSFTNPSGEHLPVGSTTPSGRFGSAGVVQSSGCEGFYGVDEQLDADDIREFVEDTLFDCGGNPVTSSTSVYANWSKEDFARQFVINTLASSANSSGSGSPSTQL